MDCVFTCLEVPWCLSMNFQTTAQNNGLHVCELLSTDKYTHPQNMVQNNAFTHFSMKSPCEPQPCLNGGTCILQNNKQEYRCQCTKSTLGKNCETGNPGYCDFETDMCMWTTDPLNAYKWNRKKGSTTSVDTGPDGDTTKDLSKAGFYVYAEATGPAANASTELRSPAFTVNSGCLQFAYHMYGSTMGSLKVYVIDNHTGTKNMIFTKSGNQGQKWYRASATVTSPNDYKVVFEVIRGSGFYSDVALDDIFLEDGECTA
ncbi:MAM and LDL-receptor class A domain-containing protein 1-like isoform X2 [Actinia tenebrosa]|nr:MAM and LDL-receptor class A domain-containing protein 1-like isoform X2 [Actinia tenebrosa]